MTSTADLLRDLDAANLREYDRQRMGALIRDFLAAPSLPATPPAVPAPRYSVPSDAKRGAG